MQYKGIIRKRDTWIDISIVVAGGVMFYIQLMKGAYLYTLILAILISAVFFRKEHIISESGVDIRYSLFGIKSVSHWDWDDITSMKPDYIKARPDVILLIAKDLTIRNFRMKPDDARGAMQLAAKMNPKLGSDFYTEEEQIERERNYAAKGKKRKNGRD